MFHCYVLPLIYLSLYFITVHLLQLRQIAAHEPQADAASLVGPAGGSQKQRSSFFRTQSRGQVSESSSIKYDQRRGSTNTNIVQPVTHVSKREVKAAKSLSIIVLFFMISWFPLYTINCVQAFCDDCKVHPDLMFFTIILTHLNSAINPFLYAYHMKDFRNALKMFILHRLLRRPVDLDYAYGRSLVSPHHSTLYRVNVTGAAPLTNLHTPHAQATPISGSLSPLPGTPIGELRSQSSTMCSCGPISSPRNVSPSLSFPPSPNMPMSTSRTIQDTPSLALRPRAATITSHTSPASARTPMATADDPSQPLLSLTAPLQQTRMSATLPAATLPPFSLSHTVDPVVPTQHNITAPHLDNLTVCVVDMNSTKSDVSREPTVNSCSTTTCDIVQEDVSGIMISGITATPSVLTSEAGLPVSRDQMETDISTHSLSAVTASSSSVLSAITSSSDFVGNETRCDAIEDQVLEYIPCKKKMNNCTLKPNMSSCETLQSIHSCIETNFSNTSNLTRCGSKKEKQEETDSTTQLTKQQKESETQIEEVIKAGDGRGVPQPTKDTSATIPNGNVWNSPAVPLDTNGSKTQSEDYTSTCDASSFPCLGSTIEQKKLGTPREGLNPRGTDGCHTEQSGISKQLSKYLPEILRRREGGLRSKNTRKTKNWWAEMMRQRSYHGISLELKNSKHVKRAQSISGAIET
ncbi:uncharacterized protein LOC121862934 [Homarus americanus]|uniref:uncharacterized protein LOC121862934 n=1 Tax=Homarus americanus TaxID=6706 RepID=UPI001C442C93|nr:uncharacterized protein LOC121862934 [Homarus americanus]